jgi:hypothetical protein
MAGNGGRRGPGPGVDAQGQPVIDPTQNVLDLVEAAIKRQDDLRDLEAGHVREIVALRASYDTELRLAESARIDAIRAVDASAVQRAAEVSAIQATTLAGQVAAAAEAMRVQVSAAATTAATNLLTALDPVRKDIADLRQVQYETAGGRAQTVEASTGIRSTTLIVVGIISAFLAFVSIVAATGLGLWLGTRG